MLNHNWADRPSIRENGQSANNNNIKLITTLNIAFKLSISSSKVGLN